MWDVHNVEEQARGQTCVKWPIVEICLRAECVTRLAANSTGSHNSEVEATT